MMLSNQIRQTFLDYFARNGHRIVPSSSLIPYGDKTILFTNAGMNQFKNVFLGLEKRDYNRAVTAQKVMRVSGKHNDLENVGPSPRHHTFFEMLGNFSLGDYFKEDAMKFALELLTKEYGLEMDRLWFTIYTDDDEAERLWIKCGVSPDRILRFGEKDNFWSMGETGPCGPCSEIHYFTGTDMADNTPDHVNAESDTDQTTVEIWNLVFMQYERDGKGNQTPLPRPSIDTGMGFERLCRVLQKGESNYDTDLFMPILDKIQVLAKQTDEERKAHYIAYRVIADHARAAAFLIGDGVLPGNEGRNYVLRMVMRRAMRFGRELGFEEPFLFQVADAVIDKMGEPYPELIERREHILNTIKAEEARFERTLDQGLDRLNEYLDGRRKTEDGQPAVVWEPQKVLSGPAAFKLYDTYGLPLEITRDVVKERGFSVDEAGFNDAREASKDMARAAGKENFAGNYDKAGVYRETLETLVSEGKLEHAGVNYDPYESLQLKTTVAAILLNGEMTDRAVKGDTFEVVLRDTCFYVESGGQVSDTGMICAPTNVEDEQPAWCMAVKDTRRPVPGLVVHVCEVEFGEPHVGDIAIAQVDAVRRWDIMRNHTATHLLQKALRTVLGSHVGQQGSLVAPDRLRFDFSHGSALTREELDQVADLLNESILHNWTVYDRQENYKDAMASGAMAFFSEKYGDVVRVVRVGEPGDAPYSAELCGGTHVHDTGDIGGALILGESAVASGVRRIEVATGRGAQELAYKQSRQLAEIAHALNTSPEQVAEQVGRLTTQLSETQKQLEQAQRQLALASFSQTAATQVQQQNGTSVLVTEVKADKAELLRDMSDWFRERHPSGVAVLGAVVNENPVLLVSVSQDLNKKGVDAGKLIKEIAAVVGGKGGGRPNFAQAGGKDASKLAEALDKARQLLAQIG